MSQSDPLGAHATAYPPEPAGWTDVKIPEAATLLGASKYWVRDQVTAGTIPHNRLGKRKGVRFTWRQICEIRALREQRPHEQPAAPAPGVDDARLARSVATLHRAKSSKAA